MLVENETGDRILSSGKVADFLLTRSLSLLYLPPDHLSCAVDSVKVTAWRELISERRVPLKIADIEILELQNIPVTPPLFKAPVLVAVRVLKVKTDDGIVGLSQIGGFMHSATAAFIQNDLTTLLKGKDPLETERLMHQMLWKFNTRAHAGVWNFAVSAIDVALWDIKGKFFKVPIWRLLGAPENSGRPAQYSWRDGSIRRGGGAPRR